MSGVPSKPTARPKSRRNKLLASMHIAAKQIGLSDDDYRDLLERLTGHRSAKDCTDEQLDAVCAHFYNNTAPVRRTRQADTPVARKCRALWISLYHLGAVDDRSEAALLAFVQRQTGKQRMEFLSPLESDKIIEALKGWAVREGVDWSPYASDTVPGDYPNARLTEALWRKLHALGVVRIGDTAALEAYAEKLVNSPCRISIRGMRAGDQIKVVTQLGRWLRRARGNLADDV